MANFLFVQKNKKDRGVSEPRSQQQKL